MAARKRKARTWARWAIVLNNPEGVATLSAKTGKQAAKRLLDVLEDGRETIRVRITEVRSRPRRAEGR